MLFSVSVLSYTKWKPKNHDLEKEYNHQPHPSGCPFAVWALQSNIEKGTDCVLVRMNVCVSVWMCVQWITTNNDGVCDKKTKNVHFSPANSTSTYVFLPDWHWLLLLVITSHSHLLLICHHKCMRVWVTLCYHQERKSSLLKNYPQLSSVVLVRFFFFFFFVSILSY